MDGLPFPQRGNAPKPRVGRRHNGLPWECPQNGTNPNGVVSRRPCLPTPVNRPPRIGHNPVGVGRFVARVPRVARGSQPWALGRNAVGVEGDAPAPAPATPRRCPCSSDTAGSSWAASPFPNGEMPPSPGLAGGTTAFPGSAPKTEPTPTGLCPGDRACRRRQIAHPASDTTPLGLNASLPEFPGLLVPRNPGLWGATPLALGIGINPTHIAHPTFRHVFGARRETRPENSISDDAPPAVRCNRARLRDSTR